MRSGVGLADGGDPACDDSGSEFLVWSQRARVLVN